LDALIEALQANRNVPVKDKVQKPSKPVNPPESANPGKPGTDKVAAGAPSPSDDLGIAERRHFIRPLPVPDAVESDGDTDWDTFQTLTSELPKD
jgi:hypothetical protein